MSLQTLLISLLLYTRRRYKKKVLSKVSVAFLIFHFTLEECGHLRNASLHHRCSSRRFAGKLRAQVWIFCVLQPVPTCSLSSSCHSTVTAAGLSIPRLKNLGDTTPSCFYPNIFRYLIKTTSQCILLGTLIGKLESAGCRAAESKSKIFVVSSPSS